MARPSVAAVGQNALASFQRMTAAQRVTLGLAFTATAIGVFLLARATGSVPMSTLYADLDSDVAAEVTTALDAQGVPYELTGGGRIIQVPSADVHQVRLDLAGQDLPGGSGGWEIVESQSVTASATVIDVAITRAMQDELARTISAIDNVRSANVHLVRPEDDLFAEDDTHASASILIDTGGQPLGAMQVQAITNLVASAVEGLSTDEVSLADETGRIYTAGGADGGGAMSLDLDGDARFRARMNYERALELDLEALLANVVGPGLAIVEVAADLDFDGGTTTTEELRPIEADDGTQLLLNETTSREFIRDDEPAALEGGELEIELPEDITIDDGTNIDEGVQYVRDDRDAEFGFGRVVTTTQNAPGEVASLSVAVLLDETEFDAARVGEIQEMVGAAVGLNEERGDTLAVTLLPFNETVKESLAEAGAEVEAEGGGLDLVALLRTVGTVIIALVVLLLAIRNLSRNPRRRVIESVELTELEAGVQAALEAGSVDAEAGEGGDADDEEGTEPPELRLQHLIANQTEDVAGVLRTWLNEEVEEVAGR